MHSKAVEMIVWSKLECEIFERKTKAFLWNFEN